ncbi:MAG: MerR family DNA-binding transcriptional regulator [Anaerotruncus sp.]|nr:MerR family DNA-binding transcriptional regulator [Anaerotruncus sp.]
MPAGAPRRMDPEPSSSSPTGTPEREGPPLRRFGARPRRPHPDGWPTSATAPRRSSRSSRRSACPGTDSGRRRRRRRTSFLTVGNLAERSGVSPRTIKHWEDKGIIEPDMRTRGRLPPLLRSLRLPLPAHPRPPALRLHARGDQGRLGRRPDFPGHRGRSRRLPRGRGRAAARRPCSQAIEAPLRQDEAARGGHRPLGGPAQEEEEGHRGPAGQERRRSGPRPASKEKPDA